MAVWGNILPGCEPNAPCKTGLWAGGREDPQRIVQWKCTKWYYMAYDTVHYTWAYDGLEFPVNISHGNPFTP